MNGAITQERPLEKRAKDRLSRAQASELRLDFQKIAVPIEASEQELFYGLL